MDLSPAERESLKAIYRLGRTDHLVKPGPLADALAVSPATVTSRLRRLDRRGLARHEPYHGVTLTPVGIALAVSAIRRHRIVERFLADVLGYDWERADDIAVTFEHDLPADVVHRMFTTLGKPITCPHGFPIPGEEADEVQTLPRLTDAAIGLVARVAVSGDLTPEVADFLAGLGIEPGVRVEVTERHPFDGPVEVIIGGERKTIGNNLARDIYLLVDESEAERTEANWL